VHGEEYSHTLLVEVAGRPLPDEVAALLVGGYVDDSLNVPDLFVLRFSDDGGQVLDKAALDIGVAVRLLVQSSGPGGPAPLISGEVTALETEIGPDGVHTIVRGLDHSHRLFRGGHVEAYVQCTATDIARKVAQRVGLKAGRMDHAGPVVMHVAQDGVNDWDFLRRLADQVGAEVAVVDGALEFRKPADAAAAPGQNDGSRQNPLVLERGVNLVSLRATVTSADQVAEVEVRGWDVASKRELTAVAPARTASAKLDDVDPAKLAGIFGSRRYVAPFATYDKQGQCDATAKAIAEHIAGGFAEIDGVARGNPRLRAGTPIALARVSKPFAGRYTLSATRHEFSPETGYLTSFTVSNRSERSLYGVSAGASGRAAPMHGVVTARVTDIKDPDQLGRVKVSFPVMSDSYESWWARPVQAGAGKGRGTVLLPEVGDEVLVAFGQGSFQQPYVLGGLYNGVDKPDKAWDQHVGRNDGAVQRRAIVSRTGMVVEMLESPNGEQLVLSTNNGVQRLALFQKRDAGIEIVSEGPLTVTAKKDVSISTTSGEVSIKGMKVSINATTDVEISAANVKATGKASAELSAGATTTVKGGIVRIN
jgi:phage protein D